MDGRRSSLDLTMEYFSSLMAAPQTAVSVLFARIRKSGFTTLEKLEVGRWAPRAAHTTYQMKMGHSVTSAKNASALFLWQVEQMYIAKTCRGPSILSLPEELLYDTSSWLNEKEFCNLALATIHFHTALSRLGRAGPCKRRLYLGTPTPQCDSPLFNEWKPPSPEASRY